MFLYKLNQTDKKNTVNTAFTKHVEAVNGPRPFELSVMLNENVTMRTYVYTNV